MFESSTVWCEYIGLFRAVNTGRTSYEVTCKSVKIRNGKSERRLALDR